MYFILHFKARVMQVSINLIRHIHENNIKINLINIFFCKSSRHKMNKKILNHISAVMCP